jgi:long-chain acyl-CoA synthetase
MSETELLKKKSIISPDVIKTYPDYVPHTIDYDIHPIYTYLERSAKNYPSNTATIFFDKKMNYKQLWSNVLKFATALKTLGLEKGDRVAIYLPNCPQFVISFFAINRIGCIIVPFNTQYVDHEVVYQINDSGAKAIICVDIVYPRVSRLQKEGKISKVEHIIVASLRDEMTFSKKLLGTLSLKVPLEKKPKEGHLSFKKLLNGSKPFEEEVEIDTANDLALIQYTGGTTGVSKGAMLTHDNIVKNQQQLTAWIYPPIEIGKEVYVCALPLFHIYALNVIMISAISQASKLILIPDPKAGRPMLQDLLESLAKYKPTFFHAIPTLYLGLLYHPDIKDYDLTSIRACISGAAPLPVETMLNFEEMTGANVVEGFGSTELSPVSHCNPVDHFLKRPGSVGFPFPDTHYKIVDISDPTQVLPWGEEGEIAVKGPQLMKGYWNKPEETANIMTEDGYYLMGDIGKVDEDGYLIITDRKKNMIDVSGLKVYPRDVEEVLYEHPAVAECAVIGVPHKFRGETVKAFIVLRDNETASPEEFIDFCKGRMARYKVPRLVEFIDELPRSAVGKILHRELRDREWKKAVKKSTVDH